MLDEILDAIIAAMKSDPKLNEVKTYHKVEGMLAGISTSVSVWVPKQRFKEYDGSYDEVDAEVHIGISVHDADIERGEQKVRALAEEIRLLLVADQRTLGGLIDNSFLSDWEYASTAADKGLMLHLAEAIWQVTYYAPRFRINTAEPVDEIEFEEDIISDSLE
ncbi:hypothetical protein DNHGIG_15080 [Collibacillus ludicampi]|uniref:Phage portal protein n=1 Tax=Collibacillus ludicampi TaxID=2771369 RepID=A0AAV4LDP0_9BACL|nr:hypothetical protein [Collibacillus ludicampi]GIM45959.1 hypothetical protein DNHGIG_15080 [Collibacillus ludicampi]